MKGKPLTTDPTHASRDGWIETGLSGGMLTVKLGGRWTMAAAETHESALARLEAGGAARARFDMAYVEALDTAGAWLVMRAAHRLRTEGAEIEFVGVQPAHNDLIDRLGSLHDHVEMEPPATHPLIALVSRVGVSVVNVGEEIADSIAFLGHTVVSFASLTRRPGQFRIRAVIHHMEHAGLNAIPIVALLSFLIGLVIAYQGSVQLRTFGAEIFVVDLVAVSILRELGILLTAIIVAGRSGSAFAAQIGAMKTNEEIDAMQTLGLDPMQVLVVPRVLALMITLPMLGFVADVMGLFGGGIMAMMELGLTPGQYIERLGNGFSPWSFGVGLVKAPFFAAIIALTGCFMGMQVTGSAESVGGQTTRAVVHSVFMVIVMDAIFSVLFAYIGI